MAQSQTRRVVFQPHAYQGMQRGINQMVSAVRPTLGPQPRVVAIDRIAGDEMPELLDDGGVIARRIIQIAGRDEDMGAMFVRQVLWHLHEKAGDGTATAAVLLESVYNQGLRYIAADGNAMTLRRYLEKGLRVILDSLADMAIQVDGERKLAEVAESICYDRPLAEMLGEIFNIIGEYGRLEVRSGSGRELEREYVEGMYWEEGLLAREMITDRDRLRTELENAAVLISDLRIEGPRQLMPVIEATVGAGIPSLLVVAKDLSKSALSVLLRANRDSDRLQTAAVETPGMTRPDQAAALEDLAFLTGGHPFIEAAGQTLSDVRPEHLGRARRAWADRFNFGIIGGRGDPRALRKHILDLRDAFERTGDHEDRRRLRERIGKLMGGSATLRVGGLSESEVDRRKELAKRTAEAMRGAIRQGVLPGGGVALLACRQPLQEMLNQSTESYERAAYRILLNALEAPMRTIISNAGYDASEVMAEVKQAEAGHGFDVRSGQVVDMAQAGIWDTASVQQAAVQGGVSSAALALTIDVLIHHEEPEQAMKP